MSESSVIIEYLRERRRVVLRDLEMIDHLIAEAERGVVPAVAFPTSTASSSMSAASVTAPTAGPAQRGDTEDTENQVAPPADDSADLPRRGAGRYGRSVRVMVLDILQSEDRWFSSGEVQELVRVEVGPARADEKLKGNVRTALYHLKNSPDVETDGEGNYRATQPHMDTGATPDTTGAAPATTATATEGGER